MSLYNSIQVYSDKGERLFWLCENGDFDVVSGREKEIAELLLEDSGFKINENYERNKPVFAIKKWGDGSSIVEFYDDGSFTVNKVLNDKRGINRVFFQVGNLIYEAFRDAGFFNKATEKDPRDDQSDEDQWECEKGEAYLGSQASETLSEIEENLQAVERISEIKEILQELRDAVRDFSLSSDMYALSKVVKTLNNSTVKKAKEQVKDLEVFGNGDMFKLLCKASSASEGWMKSTKAMEIPGVGCLVQVTTQQGEHVAEALQFVPGVRIEDRRDNGLSGEVIGRILISF